MIGLQLVDAVVHDPTFAHMSDDGVKRRAEDEQHRRAQLQEDLNDPETPHEDAPIDPARPPGSMKGNDDRRVDEEVVADFLPASEEPEQLLPDTAKVAGRSRRVSQAN